MAQTEAITKLRRDAVKLIQRIRGQRRPVLITKRGLPVAYLVDVFSFEEQQTRLIILEGLLEGERDVRESRVLTHRKVEKKLSRWLKPQRRS